MTDSTGTVVKSYTYDAFGVEESIDSSDTNPFRYCGEYYDSEIEQIYLRARYYDPSLGRFTQQDPAMEDGYNWYVYCSNNPVNFWDPWGLENIVVAGGAYDESSDNPYQYTFVDSALKKIKDMGGDATLLVANAGWDDSQRKAIEEGAAARGINLLWFSSIDSLTTYINEGGGNRANDPITSFTVFAHGTDDDNGNYAITFGLYDDDKDAQLRWYIGDIQRLNSSAFASNVNSTFYSCRTGNDFRNGNFAQTWANKTNGGTDAFRGINGRSDYGVINGYWIERHNPYATEYKNWYAARTSTSNGELYLKPGAAFRYPQATWGSAMTWFTPQY